MYADETIEGRPIEHVAAQDTGRVSSLEPAKGRQPGFGPRNHATTREVRRERKGD